MKTRCEACGKYKKRESLAHVFTPDSDYSKEDSYYQCKDGCKTSRKKTGPYKRREKK